MRVAVPEILYWLALLNNSLPKVTGASKVTTAPELIGLVNWAATPAPLGEKPAVQLLPKDQFPPVALFQMKSVGTVVNQSTFPVLLPA